MSTQNHGVMMQENGIWLSILEYAQIKDISISTVRRYIKADRVQFKKEQGKFSICMSKENYQRNKTNQLDDDGSVLELKLKAQEMHMQIKALRLENDELKMLVDLYENNKVGCSDLPAIPMEL
jgi:hypothetical protein